MRARLHAFVGCIFSFALCAGDEVQVTSAVTDAQGSVIRCSLTKHPFPIPNKKSSAKAVVSAAACYGAVGVCTALTSFYAVDSSYGAMLVASLVSSDRNQQLLYNALWVSLVYCQSKAIIRCGEPRLQSQLLFDLSRSQEKLYRVVRVASVGVCSMGTLGIMMGLKALEGLSLLSISWDSVILNLA